MLAKPGLGARTGFQVPLKLAMLCCRCLHVSQSRRWTLQAAPAIVCMRCEVPIIESCFASWLLLNSFTYTDYTI